MCLLTYFMGTWTLNAPPGQFCMVLAMFVEAEVYAIDGYAQ